jgi:hypothetical protein
MLLACAFGLIIGIGLGSTIWQAILHPINQDFMASTVLTRVRNTYWALRCVKEDDRDRAILYLRSQLTQSLESNQLLANDLKRPDLLTNKYVVQAKALLADNTGEPIVGGDRVNPSPQR